VFAQALAYGIILGIFYGLVTIGLALLFGVMKYLNLAHGSFMMLGGYICFWMFALWGVDPMLSIPVVMIAGFVLGLLLYQLLFKSLSKVPEGRRMNSSMLMTFGLLMVLDNTAIALWHTDIRTVNTSYSGRMIDLIGAKVPLTGVMVTMIAVLVIIALHLFLYGTYLGKSIRATAQDWEAANLVGVNINFTYLICCGISIALAGVAGTGIVIVYSLSPDVGLRWVLFAMVVLVLAGMGNIKEVFLAGLIMGVLEQLSAVFLGGQFRGVASLAIFVLILVLRPEGLFRR